MLRLCNFCDGQALRWLVWLNVSDRRPTKMRIPYCGYCDLEKAQERLYGSKAPLAIGETHAIEQMGHAESVTK